MTTIVTQRYDACFNPFKISNHTFRRKKNLRSLTRKMLLKLKMENVELSRDLRMCTICRIRTSKILDTNENKSGVCEPSVAGLSDYDIPGR